MLPKHLRRWWIPGAIVALLGLLLVALGVTERSFLFAVPGIVLLMVGGALMGMIFLYDP